MNSNFVITVFSITFLLTGLTSFIIISYLLYRKKQLLNTTEHEKLVLQFKQELLMTEIEVKEQTMQTIGADLHDNVGQLLSLTSFTLKSIAYGEPATMMKKVNDAVELTSRSIQEMRLLGKLLQGEQLIGIGLTEAIKQEIRWLEKAGQHEVVYTSEGLGGDVSNPEKDLILFRILQEILNNAIKHSGATRIWIELIYDGEQLQLMVKDNGIGFRIDNIPAAQLGMGLHNIHKRATMINGQTSIKSTPQEGTIVNVFIPYP